MSRQPLIVESHDRETWWWNLFSSLIIQSYFSKATMEMGTLKLWLVTRKYSIYFLKEHILTKICIPRKSKEWLFRLLDASVYATSRFPNTRMHATDREGLHVYTRWWLLDQPRKSKSTVFLVIWLIVRAEKMLLMLASEVCLYIDWKKIFKEFVWNKRELYIHA